MVNNSVETGWRSETDSAFETNVEAGRGEKENNDIFRILIKRLEQINPKPPLLIKINSQAQ